MGFHDRLIINFYNCYNEQTDLNNILHYDLFKLLLLKFRQRSFICCFCSDIDKFEICFCMKLLVYYRQRLYRHFGSRNRLYFQYFMKFQFIINVNFFTDSFEAFQVIIECYSGFIKQFYHIIPKYFKVFPFKRSSSSETQE